MRELHYRPTLSSEYCFVPAVPPHPSGPLGRGKLPTMGDKTTEHNVMREFFYLVACLRGIDLKPELHRPGIVPDAPWVAYWAAHQELERFRLWFSPVRYQVRRYHQSIPRLMNVPITSFCEALEECCTSRVSWLDCEIDYPDGKRMWDVSDEWKATAICDEYERIIKHWPFQPVDLYELEIGLKLEAAHLATIPPVTPQVDCDPNKPSIPKPMVDSATKACDAWLIKQWDMGKTLQQILTAFSGKPATWNPPLGESGVRYRRDAAYKRAGKDRPKRPQGRRSTIRSK